MYNYQILNSVNPEKWNNDLLKSSYSTFFQTFEFLNTESVREGAFPLYIYIKNEKNETKGQLGIVIHQSFRAYSSLTLSRILNLFSFLGKNAKWVSGPIIHENKNEERIKILQKFIQALDEISEKYGLSRINGYTPPQDFQIDDNYKNEFKKNNFKIQNFLTFVIDLNQTLETIWKKIHKSTKRDIKRAEKQKIIVKELSEYDELNSYFSVYETWASTKGIVSKPTSELSPFYKEYWKSIQNQIEKIFLSYQDNEIIAGHRIGCFNGIVYSHLITNSYSKRTNLGGPILTWKAIEWAKNKGLKLYDCSGGEAKPVDSKNEKRYSQQWDSLLSFKRKWGGVEYPYYHIFRINKKTQYKIFRMLNKLDWFLRNYKRQQFLKKKKPFNP